MYFTYGWPTVLQLKPRKIKKHRGFTIEDMIYEDDSNNNVSTTPSPQPSPTVQDSNTPDASSIEKGDIEPQFVEIPERVVQIQQSPIDGKYVAILTTKRLSIWSGHQVNYHRQQHFIYHKIFNYF